MIHTYSFIHSYIAKIKVLCVLGCQIFTFIFICEQFKVVKNQNKPKLQNTSPNFFIYGAEMLGKCVETWKKFFHNILFCKVKLSKMASTNTNKTKNVTAHLYSNFLRFITLLLVQQRFLNYKSL